MRILLIAQDFPPAGSPQALRWGYLSREFAAAGHDVRVLTAGLLHATAGLLELPESVRIRHVSGGPISQVMHWLETRQARKRRLRVPVELAPGSVVAARLGAPAAAGCGPEAAQPARLNWKGRLVVRARDYLSERLYPDSRGEWLYPAKRALQSMIAEIRPDLVISSHEPATTLELGLYAQRTGCRWIADMGDPVLADYTPQRWRRRAFRLERRVYRSADALVVTAPAAMELLASRHGPRPASRTPVELITQGFDDRPVFGKAIVEEIFDARRLELLYTGSFYRFRRPDALLDGIGRVPGVRLNIASVVIPDWLRPALEANPDQVRVLGYLPHLYVRQLQRAADVLVNIANDDPCQMPGKVFEYFGAGRPILHVCKHMDSDPSAAIVIDRRRGWVCADDPAAIADLLDRLQRRKPGRVEDPDFDSDGAAVEEFGWSRLASRYLDLAERVIA